VSTGGRIATVTANAALDVTYQVDRMERGGAHRVVRVDERPGGKGVNTAFVLHCLGEPVTATGLLGGDAAAHIRTGLAGAGIQDRFVPIARSTRRTVVILEAQDSTATLFNEPGPLVSSEEWAALRAEIERLATDVSVLTFSGSLPGGVGTDGYADLVSAARAAGDARVVVDTSGPALTAAAAAGPDLMKPNRAELAAAIGRDDAARGAAELRHLGAKAVVVSAGADGLLLSTDAFVLQAGLADPLVGNATGAGDAAVAALARALARPGADPLTDGEAARMMLVEAVAVSAAAVLSPVAGAVDVDDVERLQALVQVRSL
jgi:1-phosphofructokinase family hexose kinase